MIRNKHWYIRLIGSLIITLGLSLFGGFNVQAKVVDKPRVILDMAHYDSKLDKGATYKDWNERDIVNSITEKVGDKLVERGFTVLYTREKDKTTTIKDRINFTEDNDYWLYLSIHANSNDSSKPGTGCEAYSNNEWSLSNNILKDLESKLGLIRRKSPEATPYYNRKIDNSTLLEVGFINNDFDRGIMLNNQDEIATIIADNITLDYNKDKISDGEKTVTKELKMFDGSVVPMKVVYY